LNDIVTGTRNTFDTNNQEGTLCN